MHLGPLPTLSLLSLLLATGCSGPDSDPAQSLEPDDGRSAADDDADDDDADDDDADGDDDDADDDDADDDTGVELAGGARSLDVTPGAIEKLDLLFVIDNSLSMADKQRVLAQTLPDVIERLNNPACVDRDGSVLARPATLAETCPSGSAREFYPVADVHIGVITTSLGGYGAESACGLDPTRFGSEQRIDMAHLLGSLPRGLNAAAPEGFLAWQSDGDREGLTAAFSDMVLASGEYGCGFEASLESWVRFLVDPTPYTRLVRRDCDDSDTGEQCAGPEQDSQGNALVDAELLAQRERFLREDSLVSIVLLTDENDCSLRPSGQTWRLTEVVDDASAAQSLMIKSSAACDGDANDACCQSCGTAPISGCPTADLAGDTVPVGCENGLRYADPVEESANLRCFHQKTRFGMDYLYPTERYVNALTLRQLCTGAADLDPNSSDCDASLVIDNPLLLSAGGVARRADLVHLTGIVGVPWQDIAQREQASGELVEPLRYRTTRAQDSATDRGINWSWIVGDAAPPGGIANPEDPHMLESIEPRSGTNPATSLPLQDPNAPSVTADPVNGHEWNILERDELQYACIFPLVTPSECITRDETYARYGNGDPVQNCDCSFYGDESFRNPLCQGPDGSYSLTQRYAKAFPGLRQLQVLRGLGEQATVASICPKQTQDAGAADFGYRPAFEALLNRLREVNPEQCLPFVPATDGDAAACHVVEVSTAADCVGSARGAVNAEVASLAREHLVASGSCSAAACETVTLCEIAQLAGGDADSCRNDVAAPAGDGWCLLAPELGLGDATLVGKCPDTAQRRVRFAGAGVPAPGTRAVVVCDAAP